MLYRIGKDICSIHLHIGRCVGYSLIFDLGCADITGISLQEALAERMGR